MYIHAYCVLLCRFFFHATETRKNDPDFEVEVESEVDDDSETEPEEMDVDQEASVTAESSITRDTRSSEESQIDPSLADWFEVDSKDPEPAIPGEDDGDSETEPESDNVDVQDLDADIEDPDDDDWYNFPTGKVGNYDLFDDPEVY